MIKRKLIKLFLSISFLLILNQGMCQSPGVRNGHAMVYSTLLKGIILFGGADDAKVNGDTWLYSANRWKKLSDSGPSPRTFPCMVSADDYILLFGGNAVLFGNEKNPVHYLNDTWEFKNGKWIQILSNEHPDARAEVAAAYDPLRKKVILFGGRRAGEQWVAGDTWEFDGVKWTKADSTGPVARSGANMVYDTRLKQAVLSGGNPVIAREKNYNGSMWLWNGNKWSHMNATDSLIFNSCMAYNVKERFIIRFGGWNGAKRVNDTWIFKKTHWKKLHLQTAPAARNHSIMVYDFDNNACFLYGGHDGDNVFGDMWMFKHKKWKLLYETQPLRRVENGH